MIAFASNHFLEVACADLVAQAIVDALRKQTTSCRYFAASRDVELTYIDNPPLRIRVDFKRFLLKRQITLPWRVLCENPRIELTYGVYQRHFNVQTRLDVRVYDFTELQHHCAFGLLHYKQGIGGNRHRQHQDS